MGTREDPFFFFFFFCKVKSRDDCIIVMGAWSSLLLDKNEDEWEQERKARSGEPERTEAGGAEEST